MDVKRETNDRREIVAGGPLVSRESPTAMLALSNILCGLTKLRDAPASAQCHFDRAIAELAAATQWRPTDDNEAGILTDAIEPMSFYNLTKKHA